MTAHELNELASRVGFDNARILLERREQHQAGLDLACEPMEGRVAHVIGSPRIVLTPPNNEEFRSFLDRMKKIEEEFMSGIRKINRIKVEG